MIAPYVMHCHEKWAILLWYKTSMKIIDLSTNNLAIASPKYVWRVIFVESPKRPLKLIFVVLNFVTATNPGVWHCCTSDDVIDTRACNLLCY